MSEQNSEVSQRKLVSGMRDLATVAISATLRLAVAYFLRVQIKTA